MSSSATNNLSLESLSIPPEYFHFDGISDPETLSGLEKWKSAARDCLKDLAKQQNWNEQSIEVQADVLYATTAFDGKEPWTDDEMQLIIKREYFFSGTLQVD
jgi:hypothetical protein